MNKKHNSISTLGELTINELLDSSNFEKASLSIDLSSKCFQEIILEYLDSLKPRDKENLIFELASQNVFATIVTTRKILFSYLSKEEFIQKYNISKDDYEIALTFAKDLKYYFRKKKILLTPIEKGEISVNIFLNQNISSKDIFDDYFNEFFPKILSLDTIETYIFEYLETLDEHEKDYILNILASKNFLPSFKIARMIVSTSSSQKNFKKSQKICDSAFEKALKLTSLNFYQDLKEKIKNLNESQCIGRIGTFRKNSMYTMCKRVNCMKMGTDTLRFR